MEKIKRIMFTHKKRKWIGLALAVLLLNGTFAVGCGRSYSDASYNTKMVSDNETDSNETDGGTTIESADGTVDTYPYDIAADQESFDASQIDITVGDNYFSTQINDWYANFDEYEGKMVEIEGYYIGDYAPYLFVGRYGPSCPYCNGGYVSFEFQTNQDLSELVTASDWIAVTGILRRGNSTLYGDFYYIEALNVEVLDEIGMDTVTN